MTVFRRSFSKFFIGDEVAFSVCEGAEPDVCMVWWCAHSGSAWSCFGYSFWDDIKDFRCGLIQRASHKHNMMSSSQQTLYSQPWWANNSLH